MKNKIKTLALIISAIALSNAAMAQTWSGSATSSNDAYRTGNVGIGTTSPSALLDVNGGFSHFTYNSGGSVIAPSHGAGGLSIGWNRLGGGNAEVNFYNVYNNAPTAFLFSQKTGANTVSDLFSIKSNGNIGIGISNPEKNLHILGTGDARIRLDATGGSGSQKWDILSSGGNLLNSGYFGIVETDVNVARMTINNFGNVGIGFDDAGSTFKLAVNGQTRIGTKSSSAHSDAMLTVDGKVVCKDLYVTASSDWPDFVFEKNYKLANLSDVRAYYEANKHLPNVPTACEIEEKGINMSEMSAIQMQKIEELTLYIVQLKEELDALKKQINCK